MKYLITIIILSLGSNLLAQTYYNPKNTLDINVTVKEPYKPIDYNKISNDFSKRMASEIERREALKRYYDQIIFETKGSIQTSLLLTNDSQIDAIILKLNDVTFQYLDDLNNSLKKGLIQPEEYEFKVKNIYYEHINSNKFIVGLSKFKYEKEISFNEDEQVQEFFKKFYLSLAQIQGFNIDNYGKYQFLSAGFYSRPKTLTNLLHFVSIKI